MHESKFKESWKARYDYLSASFRLNRGKAYYNFVLKL